MKQFTKSLIAFLLSIVSISAHAESVTALWDFQNLQPANMAEVNVQGVTASVPSTIEGITMFVDATVTNGKLAYNSSGYAQFNNGTIIRIPVVTENDQVKVVSYPGQFNYNVGGTPASANETTYSATTADVAQGYVEIVATSTAYLYALSVTTDPDAKPATDPSDMSKSYNATWNFAGGFTDMTSDGTIASDIDGITINAIIPSGSKIRNNGNSVQISTGVKLEIPVRSKDDIITIKGYPGYTGYNINGVSYTSDTEYDVTSADAAAGKVVYTSENNSYLISISVNMPAVNNIQEKVIYKKDWNTWNESTYSTPTDIASTTRYTGEDLTFTLQGVRVYNAYSDTSKFPEDSPFSTLRAEKNATGNNIVTSPLKNISKVHFRHGATGGNRGFGLKVKGDGDEDWVTLSDAVANPSKGMDIDVNVNRTNCQLAFYNLAPSQYAFLMDLVIYANVDMSEVPELGSFKLNGKEVLGDIFELQGNGSMTATIELSKKDNMISADNCLSEITASNGEINNANITYQLNEDGSECTVTIPVKIGDNTIAYILTVKQKPDFSVTYYNTDGSLMGTQKVEKDDAIGTFAVDYNTAIAPEGQKVRGWFVTPTGGVKATTEQVITSDIKLYAVATDIEVASSTQRYDFNLADPNFYDEDHEAIDITGKASFHDTTHGWTVYNGDEIALLVGGRATITLGLCSYGSAATYTLYDTTGQEIESITSTPTGKSDGDGKIGALNYDGPAGIITIKITTSGSAYLHNVTILNTQDLSIEKNDNGYYMVDAGNTSSLITTLLVATANSSADKNTLIFLPNGTYDLGSTTLTAVGGENVSLIGQSQEGVIIKNNPLAEGISVSATLKNSGVNNYYQDLTLLNEWDYYNIVGDGRADCMQDVGTKTIFKNVTLNSHQDTYYTNNGSMQAYWEGGKICGTVDFICGEGSVFFNGTTIKVFKRKADGSGECTITAPSTTRGNTYGYVFSSCIIDNDAAAFNLGRAWNNEPRQAYINTVFKGDAASKLISTRFTPAGMNVPAKEFVEYNSVNEQGVTVSPESNIVTFEKGGNSNQMETIIDADKAATFTLDKVFTDWSPTTDAAQVVAQAATLQGNLLTITGEALAYLIEQNGELVALTSENTVTVNLSDTQNLTVRAANSRGGFGAPIEVSIATGIDNLDQSESTTQTNSAAYNLAGQRVNKTYRGIIIENGIKKLNR